MSSRNPCLPSRERNNDCLSSHDPDSNGPKGFEFQLGSSLGSLGTVLNRPYSDLRKKNSIFAAQPKNLID